MKTLFLLRHAKSSWKDASLSDFDRPLNGRGRKAASLIGQIVRQKKLRPRLLLSSPAVRARQTATMLLEASGLSTELRFDERIYEAEANRLLDVITQLGEKIEAAVLVGHNPGLEELLTLLTGEHERMQTATLACIIFDVEKWGKVRDGSGRLAWLVRPKELGSD